MLFSLCKINAIVLSASYAPNIEKFNKADGGDFNIVYSYGGDVELW